jgi:hypothetical protein
MEVDVATTRYQKQKSTNYKTGASKKVATNILFHFRHVRY